MKFIHTVLRTLRSSKIFFAASLLVIVLSLFVRVLLIERRPLTGIEPGIGHQDNEDAATHVLVTETAFGQVSWQEHKFLPLFTYGAPHNRWVDDLPTASRFSEAGYNYYTSFPPLGFVAPYLVDRVLGREPTPGGLRYFNLALGVLSAVLLARIAFLATKDLAVDQDRAVTCGILAGLVYFAAPESLKSHTISYWAHQLYEPMLLTQTIFFLRRRLGPAFFVLAFLGCLTEWTAYVANVGFAAIAMLEFVLSRERRHLAVAAGLLLINLAAGLILVGWFSLNIPITEYFAALGARSTRHRSRRLGLMNLLPVYVSALGPILLPLLIASAVCLRLVVRKWQQSGFVSLASLTTTVLAVLSLGFPLFENILLAGHVGSYSFDTLKGIAFASLIIAIAAALITKWSHAFDGLVFLAALGSIALFYQHYIGNVDFTNPRYAAHEKIGKFIRETARDGELAFYSTEVRGQLVFSAGRNLVEKLDDDSAQAKSSPVDFAREEARRRGFVDAVIYTPSADRRSISMVRLSTQNDRVDAKSFPFQFQ